MDFHILWFILLGLLLFGYAVLDGFDLGVGLLHLFVAKTDHERRIFINSIGPLWDGNEVWLVTFGGALFAAFPIVYASVFSSYYMAFMFLLFGLIFRAVAIEFRSKRPSKRWRRTFDVAFAVASAMVALLMGIAVGNTLWGIPIGERGIYQGSFFDLLSPYALLTGVLTLALFSMHGAIFLYLKTEGELQQRLIPWMWRTFGLFMVLYMFVTIITLVTRPEVTRHFVDYPAAWGVVLLNLLALGNIPRSIFKGQAFRAFLSSVLTILSLVFLFGAALFPNLVVSSLGVEFNLTVYNASSSETTLKIMSIIAAIGGPLVLTYTGIIYWIFRGKVKLGEFSY